MKLSNLLSLFIGSTVTSLCLIGNAPAKAYTFNLTGSLQNGDTFSGTYSIDDSVAQTTDVSNNINLSSYDINLYNPSNSLLTTFDSSIANNNGTSLGNTASFGVPNASDVSFQNLNSNYGLQLFFPEITSYTQALGNGIPTTDPGAIYIARVDGEINYTTGVRSGLKSASVTVKAAPEPAEILGTVGALAMGVALRRKKRIISALSKANSAAV